MAAVFDPGAMAEVAAMSRNSRSERAFRERDEMLLRGDGDLFEPEPERTERVAEIDDAATAGGLTLELLAADVDRRILRVARHAERPISKLILCHRRCKSNPTEDAKSLVRALSMLPGSRSYSGESCKSGVYIGNNVWGRGFEKRSTYCQCCGYAMEGPQIDHVQIVRSGVEAWDAAMVEQCEIGANWHDGENLGITYEFI